MGVCRNSGWNLKIDPGNSGGATIKAAAAQISWHSKERERHLESIHAKRDTPGIGNRERQGAPHSARRVTFA